MTISKNIININKSLTSELFNKAIELREKGSGVISFTAGDPYCNLSETIKDSISKAVNKECNHYTETIGMFELRKAISKKISTVDGVRISPRNIVIGNGAKQCLYNIISVLLNEGDEVLIFNPSWRAYSEIVKLAKGKPKYMDLVPENNYIIDINEVRKKINQRTRAIIINNPNNPTGEIINKNILEKLIEISMEYNIILISDEVYREIIFTNNRFYSLNSLMNEKNKENLVVINSISKSNAMAGWRLGYMTLPEKLVLLQKNH